MEDEQVTLVQESWAKVVPIAPAAAGMFYDRLFTVAPGVRPLFKSDIEEQGRKLMAMIGTVVHSLDGLDAIVPAVQDLGRRHATYGAAPEHYDVVGDCLLWTLGQGLGDEFTPDVREAWGAAYGILATTMIQAAEDGGNGTSAAPVSDRSPSV